LLPMLYSTVPELRQRVRQAVTAIEEDLPGQLVDRWNDTGRDELARRITALRQVDRLGLTDRALAAHYQAALDLSDDGSQIHFRLWGAVVVALGTFEFTCRELLGWPDGRSLTLLAGTSAVSTAPALDADHLKHYGYRVLGYDLSNPTLAECPAVLRAVPDHARLEIARDRAATALTEAYEVLDPRHRTRFERDLARARAAYPVREDNEVYTISMPLALLRETALEIGRRLATREQLGLATDVFFLEVPELLTVLCDGGPVHEIVQRRKAERVWTLAHPGPPSYGPDPGPPPPLDGLPGPARQVNEAFWWALEQIAAPIGNSRSHTTESKVLTGIPASPGRHRGPVRVIHDEAGFGTLRTGDVLVCQAFPPVWSVLLATAGALVTNQGGPLSHGAIIAREFGVPAVVATGDAVTQLRDGQMVTVNGTTGTVER
jgi:rifampicin phosphotransferase